jgi:hypothetical protein
MIAGVRSHDARPRGQELSMQSSDRRTLGSAGRASQHAPAQQEHVPPGSGKFSDQRITLAVVAACSMRPHCLSESDKDTL